MHAGTVGVGGGENVPGIPSKCATRNFRYLVRGPLEKWEIVDTSVIADGARRLNHCDVIIDTPNQTSFTATHSDQTHTNHLAHIN